MNEQEEQHLRLLLKDFDNLVEKYKKSISPSLFIACLIGATTTLALDSAHTEQVIDLIKKTVKKALEINNKYLEEKK